MCGIVGALGFVDDDLVAAVSRAMRALHHRGPDANGLWHSPLGSRGVVLGHARLAIIDLSEGGRQPMRSEAGLTTTYNGEIYNYQEVRRELAQRGHAFRSDSDTEVLLAAWEAWGPSALARLRGMFAFALWDERGRVLHLVRDRLGKKPILAARIESSSGPTLLFASELRALLATGLIARNADPEGIASALWNGFPISPSTMVRGVRWISTATHETVTLAGETTARRYWELPRSAPTAQGVDALRNAFADAVRLRLVADVPVGVFLSGGIDSSAVAALAAKAGAGSIRTFCLGFEEGGFDESQHASAVASAIGTQHTSLTLAGDEFAAHLESGLAAQDQPTTDGLNTYFVSRAVREAGIPVALAGTGGDELFGGYASFREIPQVLRIARVTRRLPLWLQRALGRSFLRATHGSADPPPQVRWGKVEDLLSVRRPVDAYQTSYGLFTRNYLERLTGAYPLSASRGLPPETYREWSESEDEDPLHTITLLEIHGFLQERLFRDSDVAAMASSLELRLPLVDHNVVEAAAAVDPERRFRPLGRKQLLRDIALGGLDPALFERRKAGFVLPIERWAREQLRSEISSAFADDSALAGIGLRGPAVRAIWESFLRGAPGVHWSRPWWLFVLTRWCREHQVSLGD
jgi:asparagine synthase (glutamine-hydrolysing)